MIHTTQEFKIGDNVELMREMPTDSIDTIVTSPPYCGCGTVLEVCRLLNRNAIGLELNPEYDPPIRERSMAHTPPLTAYEAMT